MNFDILTASILGLTTLSLLGVNISKIKKIQTANTFSLLFFISLMSVLFIQIQFFSQEMGFTQFLEYRSTAMIFSAATALASIGFLSIHTLDSKKIKTLWRLPVLGLLVGMFSMEYHPYILAALGILSFIIFFLNRKEIRILKGMTLVHVGCIVGILLTRDYQFWLYNLILILYILNLNKVWDMMRLKQSVFEVSK